MTYRTATHPSGAAVVLDAYGQSISHIHSDGKTMTPAFDPDMAQRIADLLNMDEAAARESTLRSARPWGGAHDH